MEDKLYTIASKNEEKFLRTPPAEFHFEEFTKAQVSNLVARMRRAMKEANGIGLSANQIGLNYQAFVAQVPDRNGGIKFYAAFNPKLEKVGSETVVYEEGCLSVPGVYGNVARPDRLTLVAQDKTGKPYKLKAWGLLARVIQHEMGHLNGGLFIDLTRDTYTDPESQRLRNKASKE